MDWREVGMDGQRAGRPVVVGVDGSESAGRAVRWAAREARRRHAPLRIVQAVDTSTAPYRWPVAGIGPNLHELRRRAARKHVVIAARQAAEEVSGVAVEQQVLDGFPAP